MAVANKRLADATFEQIFSEMGEGKVGIAGELRASIKRRYPKQYQKYESEASEMGRLASKIGVRCADLIEDFTLIENPRAVYKSAMMGFGLFGAMRLSQEQNEIRISAGTTQLEELEERGDVKRMIFGGSNYKRIFIEKARKTFAEETESIGRFGRMYVLAAVVSELHREGREWLPESGYFIDLMVRGLMQEADSDVARAAWRNAKMEKRARSDLKVLVRDIVAPQKHPKTV
ncbi:MAG: hypothetical protein KGH57_02590 [Candidatus Micrarchaeota archaeon]|nr:hypothetical protein [Candidatus Micrarchaeota archaeon]